MRCYFLPFPSCLIRWPLLNASFWLRRLRSDPHRSFHRSIIVDRFIDGVVTHLVSFAYVCAASATTSSVKDYTSLNINLSGPSLIHRYLPAHLYSTWNVLSLYTLYLDVTMFYLCLNGKCDTTPPGDRYFRQLRLHTQWQCRT